MPEGYVDLGDGTYRSIYSGAVYTAEQLGVTGGGGGTTTQSQTTGGTTGGTVTAQDVLNWFAEAGKDPYFHATEGVTEDPITRAQRIAQEINSGQRTTDQVKQAISNIPSTYATQALPAASQLVKVGNTYRVLLGFGGGEWGWWDITPDQLKNLYGDAPHANFTFSNEGQFTSMFGDFYMGNAGELSVKADTPWQQMQNQIFGQFGYIPGFDDPSVQRLLQQAYLEGWGYDQLMAEYRNTDYFKGTLAAQRAWNTLSPLEQQRKVDELAFQLANTYRNIWGQDTDPASLKDAALRIASGQIPEEQWVWEQTQSAAGLQGTPEWRKRQQEHEAQMAFGNEVENFTLMAENLWRDWVGPVPMPDNFGQRWGNDLANGDASEADLQNYVKEISNGRWQYKPPNLAWADWASTYKSQIRNTLELGSIGDADSLLQSILSTDLTGQDLDMLIRQDPRFLSTTRMYNELSSQVEDIGRRFGFIT